MPSFLLLDVIRLPGDGEFCFRCKDLVFANVDPVSGGMDPVSGGVATAFGMPDHSFRLGWWGFVFPNVGFTIACIRFGDALGNEGILWFGTVLTIVLVIVWANLIVLCTHAVIKRQIVWPGRDEDG